MLVIFGILVILAAVILGLIVLIQNPKGGGLSGTFGGFGNQFMGVKQTTDVLEKGTWIFGGVIAALCLLSVVFLSKSGTAGTENKASGVQVPATNQPAATPPGTLTLPQSQPATTPAKTP